jgi:anti-anti-sigma factor
MAATAFSADVPGQLQIVVSECQATVTIALAGDWDLAGRTAIREAADTALRLCPERVVLDLSRLSFIDSSGMHATADLHWRVAQQNARLEIIPGPRAVQRAFEICRLVDAPVQIIGVAQIENRETRQRLLQARCRIWWLLSSPPPTASAAGIYPGGRSSALGGEGERRGRACGA